MKITKYGHACLFLENARQRLIIDPGDYTELPADISNIEAVVITHIHTDHLGLDNLEKLLDENPKLKVYALAEVLDGIRNEKITKVEVKESGSQNIGGFKVSFFVHDHAVIYQKIPCQNLGVLIGEGLYYPGDSFHVIDQKVEYAAVPVAAPWLKIGEAIEFVKAMNAKTFFATHDVHLSDIGIESANSWLERSLEGTNKTWLKLKVGGSIDT